MKVSIVDTQIIKLAKAKKKKKTFYCCCVVWWIMGLSGNEPLTQILVRVPCNLEPTKHYEDTNISPLH